MFTSHYSKALFCLISSIKKSNPECHIFTDAQMQPTVCMDEVNTDVITVVENTNYLLKIIGVHVYGATLFAGQSRSHATATHTFVAVMIKDLNIVKIYPSIADVDTSILRSLSDLPEYVILKAVRGGPRTISRDKIVASSAPDMILFTDGSGFQIATVAQKPTSMWGDYRPFKDVVRDEPSDLGDVKERITSLTRRVSQLERMMPKPKVNILGFDSEYVDIDHLDTTRITVLFSSEEMIAYTDTCTGSKVYVQRQDGEWFKISAEGGDFLERWYLKGLKEDGCRSALVQEGKVFLFGTWLSRVDEVTAKRHMRDARLGLVEIKNLDIPNSNTVAVTDYPHGDACVVIAGRHHVEYLMCPSKQLNRAAMEFGRKFQHPRGGKTAGYAYNTTALVKPNDFFRITDEIYEAVRATTIQAPLKEIDYVRPNQLMIERDFKLEALPICESVLRDNGYTLKGKLYKFTLTDGGSVYVDFDRRTRPNVLQLDPTTYRELGKLTSRPTKDIMYKHCVRLAQFLTKYTGE